MKLKIPFLLTILLFLVFFLFMWHQGVTVSRKIGLSAQTGHWNLPGWACLVAEHHSTICIVGNATLKSRLALQIYALQIDNNKLH